MKIKLCKGRWVNRVLMMLLLLLLMRPTDCFQEVLTRVVVVVMSKRRKIDLKILWYNTRKIIKRNECIFDKNHFKKIFKQSDKLPTFSNGNWQPSVAVNFNLSNQTVFYWLIDWFRHLFTYLGSLPVMSS